MYADAQGRESATKLPASCWTGWLWAAGQVGGGHKRSSVAAGSGLEAPGTCEDF